MDYKAGIIKVWASAYGISGICGLILTPHYKGIYILVMLLSAAAAFAISWTMYQKSEKAPAEIKKEKEPVPTPEANNLSDDRYDYGAIEKNNMSNSNSNEIASPVSGEVIAIEEVPDETFSSKLLGDGIAVIPKEGKIYAPFDGMTGMVFDTKHAMNLIHGGLEILIHIGINTVELNGKFFTSYVTEGQQIKKGDLLLEFDLDGIKNAGYNETTSIIITSSNAYDSIWKVDAGPIQHGDALMKI